MIGAILCPALSPAQTKRHPLGVPFRP
jgi:hypothetical protein